MPPRGSCYCRVCRKYICSDESRLWCTCGAGPLCVPCWGEHCDGNPLDAREDNSDTCKQKQDIFCGAAGPLRKDYQAEAQSENTNCVEGAHSRSKPPKAIPIDDDNWMQTLRPPPIPMPATHVHPPKGAPATPKPSCAYTVKAPPSDLIQPPVPIPTSGPDRMVYIPGPTNPNAEPTPYTLSQNNDSNYHKVKMPPPGYPDVHRAAAILRGVPLPGQWVRADALPLRFRHLDPDSGLAPPPSHPEHHPAHPGHPPPAVTTARSMLPRKLPPASQRNGDVIE